MVLRIAIAVLIGGGVGLAVGLVSSKLGGQCPLMCNPYVSTAIGIVLALLIASGGGAAVPVGPNVKAPASDEEYRRLIEQTDGVVVVEFYTRSCPVCPRQAPVTVALSDRFAGRATVAAVDASLLADAATSAGISGVPTTLIFQNGRCVETIPGATGEEELARLIEKHLPAAQPPGQKNAEGNRQ
jgi:thioredoxin 1